MLTLNCIAYILHLLVARCRVLTLIFFLIFSLKQRSIEGFGRGLDGRSSHGSWMFVCGVVLRDATSIKSVCADVTHRR